MARLTAKTSYIQRPASCIKRLLGVSDSCSDSAVFCYYSRSSYRDTAVIFVEYQPPRRIALHDMSSAGSSWPLVKAANYGILRLHVAQDCPKFIPLPEKSFDQFDIVCAAGLAGRDQHRQICLDGGAT